MKIETVDKANVLTKRIEKIDRMLTTLKYFKEDGVNINISSPSMVADIAIGNGMVKSKVLNYAEKCLLEERAVRCASFDSLASEGYYTQSNESATPVQSGTAKAVDAILNHLNIALVPQPDGSMIARNRI